MADLGIVVLIVGFAVLAMGFLETRKGEGHQIHGGAVIMIGPIPIIFGSDAKWASIALILAIVLVVISVLVYLA